MTFPRHLLPDTADVSPDGRLSVGGIDVLDLVDEHGTPAFIYDEEHLRARCREAKAAFGDRAAYASKAFLCLAMAQLVAEEGLGIDVATGGELHVALAGGVDPAKITMHGNNKSPSELKRAIDAGVERIVINSFDEIARLSALADESAHPIKCLVRVTPGVEAHTHEYVRTGQDDSKFGLGINNGDAEKAVRTIRSISNLELVGIHAHIGSQIFVTESFEKAVELLAQFFLPLDLEELCIGGGLGVAYVEGESAPSITQWSETIRKAQREFGLSDHTITAEPGRSIVASAAVTAYTVGTIKPVSERRTYVAVDGGISDNPRPVLYGSGYEAFLARSVDADRDYRVRIVGKHCESGDIVVWDGAVPNDISVGDILVTPVTGAYGHSMASNYNKVPRPPVIFVRDGNARVVVRRETYDDLLSLDESLR